MPPSSPSLYKKKNKKKMATEGKNPINMNTMSSSLQRTGQWYEPV